MVLIMMMGVVLMVVDHCGGDGCDGIDNDGGCGSR
jgi:hypothetical protein